MFLFGCFCLARPPPPEIPHGADEDEQNGDADAEAQNEAGTSLVAAAILGREAASYNTATCCCRGCALELLFQKKGRLR